MSNVNTKPQEVTFAVNFLRYLGANSTNTYLLLAVIAWVRSESGSRYLGNNPLNIRNSPFANGRRMTKNGNGHFATFASLQVAAKASAMFLLNNHGNGYEAIIAAVRRGTPTKGLTAKQIDIERQTQAIDFLTNLALSKWDAGHYGMMRTIIVTEPGGGRSHSKRVLDRSPGAIYRTTLFRVWQGLLGHTVIIPADPVKPVKPPPPPPKDAPKPYMGAAKPFVPGDFLLPYAVADFYAARLEAPSDNPGDTER